MSYNPNVLGGNEPTGAVCLPSHRLPQPLQSAITAPLSLISLPPRIRGLRSSPFGVFVFGLGEQPVGLSGDPGKPFHVCLGFVPAHVDQRLPAAAKAVVDGTRASALSPADVPLGERQLIFRNSKSLGDRDRVLWAFGVVAFARRRAHREAAAGTTTISGQSAALVEAVARFQRLLVLDGHRVHAGHEVDMHPQPSLIPPCCQAGDRQHSDDGRRRLDAPTAPVGPFSTLCNE